MAYARGPKPVAALKELGIAPVVTAPEPNTWRELLSALDENRSTLPLKDKRVAVQEYGAPNAELLAGLAELDLNGWVENLVRRLDERTIPLGLVRLEPGDNVENDDQNTEAEQDAQPPLRPFARLGLGRDRDLNRRRLSVHGGNPFCGNAQPVI